MAMVTSRGRDMAVWLSVFTFIILVSLALRFYVLSRVKRRRLRADDYLIVVSVCSLIANDGIVIWEIMNALGAHTAELPWDVVVVHIKALFGFTWTWTTATCTCKLAILYLYLEIFKANAIFRRFIIVLMVVIVCFWITFITIAMTYCTPIWAAWDQVLSTTNCRRIADQELASISLNLCLDIAIILAPVPVIWKLQMPLRKKMGINAMFGLGLGVIIVATWRLIITAEPGHDEDIVYDTYEVALLSGLELWFGILAANLPTLAPLLNWISMSRVARYISPGKSDSSSSSPPKKHHHLQGPRLALATFGGSKFPSDGSRSIPPTSAGTDEFRILDDDDSGSTAPSRGGIRRNQEFVLYVESSSEQNLTGSYATVGIAGVDGGELHGSRLSNSEVKAWR
ncbi:hypothetical protein F5X99DRAFT_174860 [Biscogniauxia marginata]|nr:hypothetical protein F5X99DRAFT_174860 [Biscogniauxia marginata]